MFDKVKKVIVYIMVAIISLQSISANSLVTQPVSSNLKPGEVTQNKSANWVDYEKGIAEITFDVVGGHEEEPMDVILVYDNSGSMQNSKNRKYLQSRWNYASTAAKTFTSELLKNDDNSIMLIPFSDVLIDGNSLHSNPSDYFETHEFIYDENGNPDIEKMSFIYNLHRGYEEGRVSEDEWISTFKAATGILPEEMKEKNNTENAIVPFTNDEDKIINAISSLYPSYLGQTNYKVALQYAKEALKESKAERKIIVMISDGKPTVGESVGDDSSKVADEIKATGTTIYTVGTGITDEEASTLKKIASKENGASLYTSAEPEELTNVLGTLRKQFDRAASNAKIEDEINTEYFEYYSDDTYKPTVNDVEIGDDEIQVSQDKGHVTWKIGDITEKKKTLRFYVKVKDELLNDSLLDKDESFLNKKGNYATNNNANLSYKDINSKTMIENGHEMKSPEISVETASMKTIYYLSDVDGNYIEKGGKKVVLNSEEFDHKALHVQYTIAPENSITVDGEKYYVYKEDNNEIHKIFNENDIKSEFSFRYIKQLNVTFDTNGYGEFDNHSNSIVTTIDHASMTVPKLPNIQNIPEHMHFDGWNTNADGTGQIFTLETSIKKNMTVYAQWKEDNKYIVTFQDETGKELKQETVYEGEDATAPKAPSKKGYTFVGWDNEYTNVTSDITVKAKYIANKYTVKFDGNGNTSGEMKNQSFDYDEEKALLENNYNKEHHTFMGWLYNGKTYTNKEVVKNLISTANGEVTLVAQWKEDNKYTVTFQDETGKELKQETVYEGEDATAPKAPSKKGYTFVGWDNEYTNVTSDITVKAKYIANKYTVKFDGNGNTSGEMKNQSFDYDEEKALLDNNYNKEHHTFMGWLYNGKTYTNKEVVKNLISTASGEVTLVAQWKEDNKYIVTFQDEIGKELKQETVYEGEDATAPKAPSKKGYTFVGWDNEYTNVTSDITVKAKYIANKYIVKFDGNGNTSGEMKNQSFDYDEEKALLENNYSKEHHTFMGWLYNEKTYTNKEVVKNLISTANGEVTLVAQWKEDNKYIVTFQDETGKELKQETVYEGEDATAPKAPSKKGYTFVGWDNEYTNVTSDITVKAKYIANKYIVKFDGNGNTSGEMKNQSFDYDEEKALLENNYSKEHHTFMGWLYNGKTYTNKEVVKNLISTASGEVTLVAQWKEDNKYTVTFQDETGKELKQETVYEGEDATAPKAPSKKGYTFVGWDNEYTNVTSDIIVTTVWERDDTENIIPPVVPENPDTPDTPTTPDTPVAPIVPINPNLPITPIVPVPVQQNNPNIGPIQPDIPNQDVPAQPEIEVVPDNKNPKANLEDNKTPKAKDESAWALVNLICSILTVLLIIAICIGKRSKDKEDEDQITTYKRRKWTMVTSVIVGLGSVIAFILTENITLPMIMIDKWSFLMIAILIVQIVVLMLAKKWKDDEVIITTQV